MLITGGGKQDSHVGWNEKPRFAETMEQAHQQLYFYWANTGHSFETVPFDSGYKRANILKYRRNQSHVAITNLSINDDPGEGTDLLPGGQVTGDEEGTINGYADWDTSGIVDTPSEYRIKVYLIGSVMDQFAALSGVQTATATLTPRRLQQFVKQPNQDYLFENRRSSDNALNCKWYCHC